MDKYPSPRGHNEAGPGAASSSNPEKAPTVPLEEAKPVPPMSDDSEASSVRNGQDILALQDLDPALNAKMHLVNNAIDEIGWTNYHWKLFCLNGFGYAVDSLVLLLQSVIAGQAYKEFGRGGYANGLTIAAYVGMLVGAVFWGLSADMVGRRHAFNLSLFICSVAAILAGAMPHWAALGVFIALVGFGAGGNLVMDTTVFLEYLPSDKQWVLTFLACWWGLGQAITGFIAWGFLAPDKWNCADAENCSMGNNMGWRYTMFTAGSLVLVMSVLRVTVVRLRETPKYLLGTGDDAKLVETIRFLASQYNRPCALTLAQLQACGTVHGAHHRSSSSPHNNKRGTLAALWGESAVHFRGLFATRQMAASTLLIWLSWALIGLAYPLFYVFLDDYLASRGATFAVSTDETWRNYALVNVTSVFGPMLAGWLCNRRLLGRRYTMVIGALATGAFFFAYTAVRTKNQNVAFSCAISFCLNVYYGVLYAYTPEVLPSAHRATGNGVAVACNRIMGIVSAGIASASDTATAAPIYVCAALFVAMASVSAVFPFEPFGRRSS